MKIRDLLTTLLAFGTTLSAADIESQVSETQSAHHLSAWWEKDLVEADVVIDFGETRAVDGTFLFEAHGPKARYERADGTVVIFDGTTAWVSPSDAEAPMGRFHVLTWPWFIIAPFKMQGDGIELSELEEGTVNGEPRVTLLQTFATGVGDTPDDWYRFFIDPETNQITEMSYIVTYGKDAETANESPSIIRYLDYTDGEEPVISQSYEFWYWDPVRQEFVGNRPKATGKVSNIRYPDREANPFSIPEGARELMLPDQN